MEHYTVHKNAPMFSNGLGVTIYRCKLPMQIYLAIRSCRVRLHDRDHNRLFRKRSTLHKLH